ncbi:MAG TPA: NAD(P)-binding protein [Bdellovibrionales bacterium]|jgi:hypothetical protein|nr:NAD(P)-binding protein [Bdellovibrionales bacterium]
MAQSKTIKTHEYDSIVIGGGLSGLLAANQLESTGRKVALIEAHDTLGGMSRAAQSPAGAVDHVLKFFPVTDDSEEMFAWLESVIGRPIERTIVEAPPINYDEGKFKPFIGFGDDKVETAGEIDAYAKSRFYELTTPVNEWISALAESFTGTLLTNSYVTKMQVEDAFVIEILVNGSKRISAREVIFAATPQQLSRILPDEFVTGRLRQKLLKGEFWTGINLDLVHKGQVTESRAVHILKGANEEPSTGVFHPAKTLEDGSVVQVSQWVTLVPRDITDESELTGSALKQIKRQVKRAYENSLEGLLKERIVVSPTSHGDFLGTLEEDGRWPKLSNLWVISSFLDKEKNVSGAIRQARRTLASIAGEPATIVERDTDLHEEGPQPTA